MSQNLILFPVFVQVLLTYVVLGLMIQARAKSRAEYGQTPQDMAVAPDQDWNLPALKVSNNYENLFELPVLFYAVTAFALITRQVDVWMLGLAWAFVVARIAHSVLHIGRNIVLWRGTAFAFGAAILMLMWLLLFWRVAAAGF